jgi:hypothetical protein
MKTVKRLFPLFVLVATFGAAVSEGTFRLATGGW